MIRHIVLFSASGAPAVEVDELIAMLNALEKEIDVIQALSCGRSIGGNTDAALVVDFESREDLEIYRDHPAHIAPLKRLRDIAESIFVADLEVA